MSDYLCISIHFLDGAFHGRGNHGEPEWPPSPLRLFQALVAANARLKGKAEDALQWLEDQDPPAIITSKRAAIQPQGHTTHVPDNVSDLAAKSWSRGKEKDISKYRIGKFIRPIFLANDGDIPAVHYLWSLESAADTSDWAALFPVVRAVSQFGWGIDLVVADLTIINDGKAEKLNGERWQPSEKAGGQALRVPIIGTFADLGNRYKAFLARISLDSNPFIPVPPLSQYTVATYRRESEISHPPYAVFALRRPDDSGFAAFAPVRRGLHLSGMLRHLAKQRDFAASLGWDDNRIASFVLGHGEMRGDATHRPVNDSRLVFIPLPSIEYRGKKRGKTVGAVRRVLVTVKGQINNAEFDRIVRNLEGRELIEERTEKPIAFLRHQPDRGGAIESYFAKSSVWATVTPIILPGYDDPGKLRRQLNTNTLTSKKKADIIVKLETRIEALLRKALRHDGYPEEIIRNAELQWRGAGFIKGVDLARNYAVPDQHRRYRRLHVRIVWRSQEGNNLNLSGPICIGGGRFTGLGLFTSE